MGIDEATLKAMSILELEIYENYNEYMEVAHESNKNINGEKLMEIIENYQRSYFLFKVKNLIESKREDVFLRVSTIPIKINLKKGLSDYYNYKSKFCEDSQFNEQYEYLDGLLKINDHVMATIKKKELEILYVNNIFNYILFYFI